MLQKVKSIYVKKNNTANIKYDALKEKQHQNVLCRQRLL